MKTEINSALGGLLRLDLAAFPAESELEPADNRVMKTRTSGMSLFLSVGAITWVAFGATAETTAPSETTTPVPAASEAAPPKLPYGVDQVLKLSQAQVSEDVTLNYIKNSGTIYNLSPKDIVYLRNEGVSDKVVNAMIDQRQNVPADVANQNALQAQAAASAIGGAPASADANTSQPAPVYFQPQPFYVEPTPVYVPVEPEYTPASTLYVIPYGPSVYPPHGFPSFYFGSRYGGVSTVYSIGRGYGGPRYYGHGYRGGGHRSSVYHFGRGRR
jgi:hypothetical protein